MFWPLAILSSSHFVHKLFCPRSHFVLCYFFLLYYVRCYFVHSYFVLAPRVEKSPKNHDAMTVFTQKCIVFPSNQSTVVAKKDKTTLLVKLLTKSFYPFWPPLYFIGIFKLELQSKKANLQLSLCNSLNEGWKFSCPCLYFHVRNNIATGKQFFQKFREIKFSGKSRSCNNALMCKTNLFSVKPKRIECGNYGNSLSYAFVAKISWK